MRRSSTFILQRLRSWFSPTTAVEGIKSVPSVHLCLLELSWLNCFMHGPKIWYSFVSRMSSREHINTQMFALPRMSAVKGKKSIPSVYLLVSALPSGPFDSPILNLMGTLPLIISQRSLKVKVINQARSQFWKKHDFQIFSWCELCRLHRSILSWHMLPFAVTVWQLDVFWQLLGKNTNKEGT